METGLFVQRNTAIAAPPLLPEIRLHLATEVTQLWQATEEGLRENGLPPPFWAFAWAGGQALARYLLDNPEIVKGHEVLDIGSGSGIVAIAAAIAGAAAVMATDIDPFATAAIPLNAAVNGVAIEIIGADLLDTAPNPLWPVVTAGDVCYERPMAERTIRWLRWCAGRGSLVLLGDPGRAYLPRSGLVEIARYAVPTSRELEAGEISAGVVWQVLPE